MDRGVGGDRRRGDARRARRAIACVRTGKGWAGLLGWAGLAVEGVLLLGGTRVRAVLGEAGWQEAQRRRAERSKGD
eukprot:4023313-Prymnesium_polylepis.1